MNYYTRLILFVEGKDDRRFAESVLCPLAEPLFDHVEVYEYAEGNPAKVRSYINQIRFVPDWSYVFIADFDQGPCVTLRKDQLVSRYGNLDAGRIMIVSREIESWYLAGLDSDSCHDLGVQFLRDTNDATKERFDNMTPSRFENRADFMVEVLNKYNTETARIRNVSFDYAMGKHFRPIA